MCVYDIMNLSGGSTNVRCLLVERLKCVPQTHNMSLSRGSNVRGVCLYTGVYGIKSVANMFIHAHNK